MKHDLKRGALLLASATLFTAALNALQKLTGTQLPALEIIFFRNLFSLPFVLLIAARTKIILKTHHFGGHLLRSVVGLVSMIMVVVTVTRLPLAEQQVLSYTQPLFLVLLSIPLLHEKPSLQRWIAVSIGFAGVLVVASGKGLLHGSAATVPNWAYFVALAQGAVGALTTMQIRQLSATEASTTIALWQAILMTLMTALPLPFIWTTPGMTDALCLVAVGAFAGIAQVLQTEAFASAQVSAIGPFAYSGLLWAGLIGWFGFGEVPGVAMMCGGLLIVGSGVWMLRHDRPARQQEAVATGTMDAATGTPP
ncbi:S-adenosylmethionine uptake transporter [Gluconacetobacter sp. SXCC-1]|uniref:DMT family transporter n=1 Tax=Komagataeibacter rhaeticus TaxID=215221 RepID=A0A181C9G2_9PROT|nr:DMT family transporter [Komagataeibacter rhaeticus]ATU73196.1 EamA/RhaT family transporter [Komagataeibacter xylinus]EGG76883.1 S-adenosylmethionine uptake transporter [Gluconacetobacter sp. SXCC-1]QIP35058.1 DMT family transporter [Komagataeibacter rhaeticus]QOC47611.1 DMT family transporter [Komagataeibacter rhaeticus]WPP23040.1 DMT family transporter [Komagataeibacter rhaeticus]